MAGYEIASDLVQQFSKEEIAAYQEAFKKFDKDGNGFITRDEIKKALSELGQKVSDAAITMTMQKADIDQDGKVSFSEYLAVMSRVKLNNSASLLKVGVQRTGSTVGFSYHSYSQDEKRAFAEHINNCLARDPHMGDKLPVDLDTEELFDACKDGLLICKLINLAEFDTIDTRALNVPTPAKPELSIFHKVENMNLALNAARGIGCVVTNVNAKDIIDGNQILILGIIWQIIRIQLLASISLTACPELVALLTEEEELEDLLNLQPEALLVRWFNYHLENAGTKRRVHNFGKDLADGECLSILLHHIDPTSCDLCDEADATQRAQHIIMNAKALGVETFIQPADIVKANKKLLMAFVAQIFNTSPSLHVEAADLEEVVANFANLDLDDAGDTREEKVFRMWINSLGIDGGDLYIHNLFHDVQDGVAILKVMDAIQPGVVTWKRVNIQPKNRYKKVENGNYVIEIAKVMGLTVVNVGGLDIIDGNKKMTLAIIWQLMRRHTLNLLEKLSHGGKRIEDPEIVRWANKKVPTIRIKGFSDQQLSSGVFLLKVCHGINRGVVNWDLVSEAPATKEDKLNNAKYAISVARKLGALVFCVPDDIVEVRSRMIMMFCASLWHAENEMKAAKEKAEAEAAAIVQEEEARALSMQQAMDELDADAEVVEEEGDDEDDPDDD